MLTLPFSAFLAAFALYGVVLLLFPKLGLLDFPERYGLSRGRIPYPAGIVAIIVFLCFLPVLSKFGQKEIGLVISILLLGAVSFIDDRTPLPSWLRLLVQVLVAVLLFATGSRIYSLTNPLGGIFELNALTITTPLFGQLPLVSCVFTIVWLLLTINALNWFDGVSGQVSVISVIGFLMLGLLAYFRNDQPEFALLAFTLAGIAAAGAFYDFPPAKLLLGDTGSMFFGLMLGLLGIYQGGKVATIFLALGIPLLDSLFVILVRLSRGHSPLHGGRDHLHHILLKKGLSERSIVIATAVLGSIFGATALYLTTFGKFVEAGVLMIILGGIQLWARRR